MRVVDESGREVAVRIHFHGAHGEYLPPRGNHRKVNGAWFEDNYGEFVNGLNQYAYIPGHCELEAPRGEVFVEISRGYEMKPIRSSFQVTEDTREITFRLDKLLDWSERGWASADTHVHFLSPQTAWLEGAAEGVNVVNLLASQWGEMYSNVSDFDGRRTFGASDFGGDGEFLVRVGTENRMQTLGHISLLGYSGAMIHPLCTGGPSESAIGDALEVSMAQWAQQCIDQGGLGRPAAWTQSAAGTRRRYRAGAGAWHRNDDLQSLRLADPALWLAGLVSLPQFGLSAADIGRLGQDVGGRPCWAASAPTRIWASANSATENWMESVKAGNTFVTVGPLLELTVEGMSPGQQLDLPAGGGTVDVSWRVESAALPIHKVEVVVGGFTQHEESVGGLKTAGSCAVTMGESSWVALRVRGSHAGREADIAAHSSSVQARVGGARPFKQEDALAVLQQIEGALAYIDTLAPRPVAQQYKRVRASVEAAHNRLHQLMHRQGRFPSAYAAARARRALRRVQFASASTMTLTNSKFCLLRAWSLAA